VRDVKWPGTVAELGSRGPRRSTARGVRPAARARGHLKRLVSLRGRVGVKPSALSNALRVGMPCYNRLRQNAFLPPGREFRGPVRNESDVPRELVSHVAQTLPWR
jgi:hypothetical protein